MDYSSKCYFVRFYYEKHVPYGKELNECEKAKTKKDFKLDTDVCFKCKKAKKKMT